LKKYVYILNILVGQEQQQHGVVANNFGEALQKVRDILPGAHVDVLSASRGPEITIE
jgi:hypothetical protein